MATAQFYGDAFPITPSDSVNLERPAVLYVGTAGDIKCTTISGRTVTLKSVPVGLLPLKVTKVFATGTAATNMTGLVPA